VPGRPVARRRHRDPSARGREVIVGRARLLAGRGLQIPEDPAVWCRALEETGCTTVLAAWDDEVRGAFATSSAATP
jgi:P-type Cu+ transporter